MFSVRVEQTVVDYTPIYSVSVKEPHHNGLLLLLLAASFLLLPPRTGGSKAGDVGWLGGQTLFLRIFALPRRAFLFLSKNCFVSINFWAQTRDWEKAK
jgi:hypothetical protein